LIDLDDAGCTSISLAYRKMVKENGQDPLPIGYTVSAKSRIVF
jgi:hypothetical protein